MLSALGWGHGGILKVSEWMNTSPASKFLSPNPLSGAWGDPHSAANVYWRSDPCSEKGGLRPRRWLSRYFCLHVVSAIMEVWTEGCGRARGGGSRRMGVWKPKIIVSLTEVIPVFQDSAVTHVQNEDPESCGKSETEFSIHLLHR